MIVNISIRPWGEWLSWMLKRTSEYWQRIVVVMCGRQAQEALKKLEDMTFTDEEIDAFLPKVR